MLYYKLLVNFIKDHEIILLTGSQEVVGSSPIFSTAIESGFPLGDPFLLGLAGRFLSWKTNSLKNNSYIKIRNFKHFLARFSTSSKQITKLDRQAIILWVECCSWHEFRQCVPMELFLCATNCKLIIWQNFKNKIECQKSY